ncbi:MAG: UDP-N-acetylmuramoyl-tripeptide--D-alanyl-D-alanine ligase [Paludibacteraceae bacterium]|nr:UDP-N-acetylmuramoyl-tripeptide--D-alanyl-D-alanine ligase [Paludibacteraceae bacterium]
MDWSCLIRNKESLCVSTDTRNLPAGCVFFALHGATFDGNTFAAQALEQGASVAVIDNPEYAIEGKTILVLDTLLALQELAREWRRTLNIPIIAITGTNGKTTTKELTAAVLATCYKVHYTQGNLNNQIGVPLTLLQLTRAHEIAIIEMGASHPGDIKELVEIAEPTCGLITNVGRAHLQGFGSFEGVMSTKAELYDYLRQHDGFIFRNTDNPYLAQMAGELQTIAYTTGIMPEQSHLVGAYNAENISAAICVGEYFGVSENDALTAVCAYEPSNKRSQRLQTARNTIIVDAYNANPTSMQAAINAFKGDTYILGEMRELGEYSHLEHQNIVNMLLERKADKVLLVGKEYKATTAPYPIYDDVQALCAALQAQPIQAAHILLKGSRGNKLEESLPYL